VWDHYRVGFGVILWRSPAQWPPTSAFAVHFRFAFDVSGFAHLSNTGEAYRRARLKPPVIIWRPIGAQQGVHEVNVAMPNGCLRDCKAGKFALLVRCVPHISSRYCSSSRWAYSNPPGEPTRAIRFWVNEYETFDDFGHSRDLARPRNPGGGRVNKSLGISERADARAPSSPTSRQPIWTPLALRADGPVKHRASCR